jgi:integral membrane protein (TIGR01906 family)
MTVVKHIAFLAFVVSVPLFLIATNVRILVNAPALYSYGFDRYPITTLPPIDHDELLSAGKQVRDYFNNEEPWIDVVVQINGVTHSLYGVREIDHMWDVKVLVRSVYNVQVVTGLLMLLLLPMALAVAPRTFPRTFFKLTAWGSGLTLAIIGALGIFALTGFSRAFETFHVISFDNDLWQLDPYENYLIAMFPEGFFFDATMIVAAATVLQAILVLIVSSFVLMKTGPKPVEVQEGEASPTMVQTQYGAVPEHLTLTPEDRAAKSHRSVVSEGLADKGIIGYYIAEVALLALVPAILLWRRSRSAEAA